MGKTKFYIGGKAVTDARLAADFSAAPGFDKVRVGKLGVYFTTVFRTSFYSYGDFTRAFVRMYEGTSRLCCGSLGYNYTSLVLTKDGQPVAEVYTESEAAMHSALAEIHKVAPEIAIGAPKNHPRSSDRG